MGSFLVFFIYLIIGDVAKIFRSSALSGRLYVSLGLLKIEDLRHDLDRFNGKCKSLYSW